MKNSLLLPGLVSERHSEARLKLRLMARVQMYGWFVVTALLVLATVAPVSAGGDDTVLLAIAGFGLALGLLIGVAPQSWALCRVSVYAAVLAISLAIAFAQPGGAGRLLYLWPVMSAAHFLSRRDLIAVVVLIVTTLLPALLHADPEALGFMYTMTVATIIAVALMQRLAVEQLQRMMHTLAQVAITDSLTGLLDRRGFLAALERDLERARRSNLPVTLAQFDLDRFKSINDNFGHAAGDDVLAEFARVLEAECRATDVPARIGGEEFAVLLFDADEESGLGFAERVATRLEGFDAPGDVPITVSAGVAAADRSATASHLLWAADGAVYDAKARGRDQIVVVAPEQLPLVAA